MLATGDLILNEKTQVDLRPLPTASARPPRPTARTQVADDEEETAEVDLRTGDYESVEGKKPLPRR
ncbi:MAG: hypothetical protein ACHREM_29980 [Polyangiales bacterium]